MSCKRINTVFWAVLLALAPVCSASAQQDSSSLASPGGTYGLRSSSSSTPMLDAIFRIDPPGNEPRQGRARRSAIPTDIETLRRRRGRAAATDTFKAPAATTQSETLSVREEDRNGDFNLFGLFGGLSPLAGTEQQLRSLQDPINNLAQPIHSLHQPISELKEPIRKLREPVEQLEAPMRGLEQGVNKLEQPLSELSKIKQPIENLAKPVKELKQPIESLREPLNGLTGPVKSLTEGTRQLRGPLLQVGKELTGMQKPIADLHQPLSAISEPLGKMNKPLNALPKPIESLSGSVSGLRGEVRNLQAEVGSLKDSIQDISRTISFAVIGSAILIGGAILMHRKIASVTEPTKTTVEEVVEEPIDMQPEGKETSASTSAGGAETVITKSGEDPASTTPHPDSVTTTYGSGSVTTIGGAGSSGTASGIAPGASPQLVPNRWEQAQNSSTTGQTKVVKTVMTTAPANVAKKANEKKEEGSARKNVQASKTVQDFKVADASANANPVKRTVSPEVPGDAPTRRPRLEPPLGD